MVGFGAAGALVLARRDRDRRGHRASGGDDGGGDDGGARRAASADGLRRRRSIPPKAEATDLEDAAKAANCKVKHVPERGRATTSSGRVKYKTNPPTSGDHTSSRPPTAPTPRRPRSEQLVHALEHGRVVLWFQPDASPQLKGQLKALFDEDPLPHGPRAQRDARCRTQVAASAWTRSITCDRR